MKILNACRSSNIHQTWYTNLTWEDNSRLDSALQPTPLPQAPAALYPVSKQQLVQGRYLWSRLWEGLEIISRVHEKFNEWIFAHNTQYVTSNHSCYLQRNCSCYKSHECALKLHCWQFIFSIASYRKRDLVEMEMKFSFPKDNGLCDYRDQQLH